MSLYDKLFNHVTNVKVHYTDMKKLYEIGKEYKQSNVERTMRKIVEDTEKIPYWGFCVKPQFDADGKYIVGYYKELKNKFDL